MPIQPGGDAVPLGAGDQTTVTAAGADHDRSPIGLLRMMDGDPDFGLLKLTVANRRPLVPEADPLRLDLLFALRLGQINAQDKETEERGEELGVHVISFRRVWPELVGQRQQIRFTILAALCFTTTQAPGSACNRRAAGGGDP